MSVEVPTRLRTGKLFFALPLDLCMGTGYRRRRSAPPPSLLGKMDVQYTTAGAARIRQGSWCCRQVQEMPAVWSYDNRQPSLSIHEQNLPPPHLSVHSMLTRHNGKFFHVLLPVHKSSEFLHQLEQTPPEGRYLEAALVLPTLTLVAHTTLQPK